MNTDNNYTTEMILEQFKDEISMNQIKNLEKQLILFDLREKEKNMNNDDPQILKGNEQIIFSIISSQLLEKIKYFTDSNKITFNYELFIQILMELIKSKVSSIYKNSKIFGPNFFKEMNKNIIKKKQSITLDFLLSFYDDKNINELTFEQINSVESKQDSFLISCVKIILIMDIYVEKIKMEEIFGQFKIKENKKIINKLSLCLIQLLYIFIRIKKSKNLFEENISEKKNISNNTLGHYDYDAFSSLIEKTYDNNIPSLIALLFDVIFNYDLCAFFKIIMNKDDTSQILTNNLVFEPKIRYRFLKLLNNLPLRLGEIEQKELLKTLGSNNTIITIFIFISDDIKNKIYNNEEILDKLFIEVKILYFFSILINSKDSNIEKIIINISKEILFQLKDKVYKIFENFINEIFKLGKKIPKYKNKLYNFIFLISESIPNLRKNILKIFFLNIKGNLKEYQNIKEKMKCYNLFIKNLYNYEGKIISFFFDFLESLIEKDYFPLQEITQILDEIPNFKDISSAKILIKNLNKLTINNKNNNININICGDNINLLSDNIVSSDNEEEKKDDKFKEFRNKIFESFLNVLYKTIVEIKDNIYITKSKSPFDVDVTLSSIINTNYSCLNDETNKTYISVDILMCFIDFLSIVLKEEKMFQIFISKNFLEFFPYLINDDEYKIIAYKLIKIYFESHSNNEKNKEKNERQIKNIFDRYISISNRNNNEDEISKFKEIILMMDSIKIIFSKKSIISIDFINKILEFYQFYPEYMNKNYKECSYKYNKNYHSFIKDYLDIIFELIIVSNRNIIMKNHNYIPITHTIIKGIIENIIKFYVHLTEEKETMEKYFLDIIKYFIDKSINLYPSSKEKFEKSIDNDINNKDFSLYYINRYKINTELLTEKNERINKRILSNFCIQRPFLLIILLKVLFKYNKYIYQYIEFLSFLCKLNRQNITLLLKHNLFSITLKIVNENPKYNQIILKLLNESFKYFEKKDFFHFFGQIISLLNNSKDNEINKNIVKELLQSFIKTLQNLNNANDCICKGIVLSENKIEQMNVYNLITIKNLKLISERNNKEIDNLYIKQEIYFYNSMKTKKLLLLRISNCYNGELNADEKIRNEYIEIFFRDEEIKIIESSEKLKYVDLSNFNSIFIDDDSNLKNKQENYLKLNEKNIISYLFKLDKKILVIHINGHKIFSYKYKYIFNEKIDIEIGYPLDLVEEKKENKFELYNHIIVKSFDIFSKTKEDIENIYKLSLEQITCNYLFPDELTDFKLDENTYLLSKYNNINSVLLNCIFKNGNPKKTLYKNCFFHQISLLESFNYLLRLEKYIFVCLNSPNIDKIIFNELIQLLCIYLIMNKSFINKFLSKEEISSSLYFSLYKHSKFIDKNTIENLLSVIFVNKNINNSHNLIIDMLLDVKIFELMNSQAKIDLINIINNNFFEKKKNIINKFFILEKFQTILILCLFNNKNIDEIILNIIFKSLEENSTETKVLNILEELIFILFHFDQFLLAHISKFKTGKNEHISKIINEYFCKIYNNKIINYLKNYILQKLEKIVFDIEIKNKINRLINSYSPSKTIEQSTINKGKIFNFEEDDYNEDDLPLFNLPKNLIERKRSSSFSKIKAKYYCFKKESTNFKEIKINKYLSLDNKDFKKIIDLNKVKKTLNNDFSIKFGQLREPSLIPSEDVIIFKGVIKGKHRKTYKNTHKSKILKTNKELEIIITDKDKEKCNGDCHLCLFIRKLLILMFKREKNYEIYKNNLLNCIKEIFILDNKKDINFKFNFSYYLIKREGPDRIRKRFNIRIDKILNREYDRTDIKYKNVKTNELLKLFEFYEKKETEEINSNLMNFFNLGQIFNINIIHNLVDEDDEYQESFNCLLFKGITYIDSVLILGKKKIYIISRVNLSQNNILYNSQFPISKKFWILNDYEDILSEQCIFLNSYENKNETKQYKKKKFQ